MKAEPFHLYGWAWRTGLKILNLKGLKYTNSLFSMENIDFPLSYESKQGTDSR